MLTSCSKSSLSGYSSSDAQETLCQWESLKAQQHAVSFYFETKPNLRYVDEFQEIIKRISG
jgi:hypothetical protein